MLRQCDNYLKYSIPEYESSCTTIAPKTIFHLYVDENVTFKNRKSVSTLRGTDNVCVTDLSYQCKFPNCLYSCEFKKKVEGQFY